jgi:hypothetical protein
LVRLESFPSQSSRQTGSTLKKSNGVYARPHPGPLPRGEGEANCLGGNSVRRDCSHRPSAICSKTHSIISNIRITQERRMILPLLGARAGVRADVTTNFSRSRITHHASRN